jgi:hypothetical protein
MKNEIMKNEMSSVGTPLLRLPPQTAPVERTLAASALLGKDGIVPSARWTDYILDMHPPIIDFATL